jgi:transposase
MDYTNNNLNDTEKTKLSSIEDMFINMRASGKTVREIAKNLKKSYSTISDLNKKYFRQVADLKNEKLEVLQKKMYEQKQDRLDFLTGQLDVLKAAIKEKQIFLTYKEMVTLAINISLSLNKLERDMQISDLLNSDFSDSWQEKSQEQDENISVPETNVSGENPDNNKENKEVAWDSENPGNAETKNKESVVSEKKKIKNEKKNEDEDAPPVSRADYYKRVLRDKMKSQKPPG